MSPSSIVCELRRRYANKIALTTKCLAVLCHRRMEIGKCLYVPVYGNKYVAWCVRALFGVSPYFTTANIFPQSGC
jgi:hypothetical protein